ncbi:MAG: M23 family metallopeptidase [Thermomonas sp.]
MRGLLLFVLGVLVGANAAYFVMTRNAANLASVAPAVASGEVVMPRPGAARTETGSPQPRDTRPLLPPPVASMRGTPPSTGSMPAVELASGSGLLIPVQGIKAQQLSDTFTDSRSAGRLHDAIDIMAPTGTPVIAVADGHVEKLFNSKLGGLTLYQFNLDGTLAYYYAHLQRYADGIAEGQAIQRGQRIGYVGYSGNASPEGPHLHFAIFVLGPEKEWWKGEAINPYPQLGGAPH